MKKKSILFTINITFLISFILATVSFVLLYNYTQKQENRSFYKKGVDVSKIFIRKYMYGGLNDELSGDIESLDYSVILDKDKISTIIHNQNAKNRKIRIREIKSNEFFKLKYIVLDKNHYIYIKAPDKDIVLKDNSRLSDDTDIVVIAYFAIVLIFIFLYFSIINKLKPLKLLKERAKSFGNENFDLDISTSNEDEISELANEFELSAKKLKNLKESRNIFIRNIMHELKTPITKGKILVHLPATEKNTESMQKVFYRLESLINEFADIEELISTKKELEKREYSLEDIIDNSVDILMCDEEEVVKEFENIKLNVDFNIFSIAIKNLIDNGIKYSDDKKMTIKSEENKIIFQNRGKELLYPIEDYFEPFFRGGDVKSNQSFGLGLYIVNHILDAHNLKLQYERDKDINRFIIL